MGHLLDTDKRLDDLTTLGSDTMRQRALREVCAALWIKTISGLLKYSTVNIDVPCDGFTLRNSIDFSHSLSDNARLAIQTAAGRFGMIRFGRVSRPVAEYTGGGCIFLLLLFNFFCAREDKLTCKD